MMELNETLDSVLIIATYTIAARLLAANTTPVAAAGLTAGLVDNLTANNWSTTASDWEILLPPLPTSSASIAANAAASIANYTQTKRTSSGDDNSTVTTTNDDIRWPIDSVGSVDQTTAATTADATASLVAEWYGKLLQPAVMNSFNVTLEYIETTGRPDADDDEQLLLLASAALAGGHHNATTDADGDGLWLDREGLAAVRVGAMAALLAKWVIMSFIILAAIFGNMLVIVSVMQHRRLR